MNSSIFILKIFFEKKMVDIVAKKQKKDYCKLVITFHAFSYK